jgi:tape measure domain-containing protein
MARKDVDLVIRAKDEAASVVDRITKAINDFTDAQSDLGSKASKTESVFGRLGAAIAGLDKAVSGLDLDRSFSPHLDRAASAVSRLEKGVATSQAEVKQLSGEMARAEAIAGRYEAKMSGAAAALARQKDAVAKAKAEQRDLAVAYEAASRAVDRAASRQAALPAIIERQVDSVRKAEARYRELSFALEATTNPSQSLVNSLAASERSLVQQRGKLAALQSEYAQLAGTLEAAQSAAAIFGAQSERATANLADQQGILAKIEANYADLSQRSRVASQGQTSLATSLGKATAELGQQTSSLTRAETEYAAISAAAEKFQQALSGSVAGGKDALGAQLVEQGLAVQQSRREFEQLSAAVSRLKQDAAVVAVFRGESKEMAQDTAFAAQKAEEAQMKFLLQQEALERLGQAYAGVTDDIRSVAQVQGAFAAEQTRLAAALRSTNDEGFQQRQFIRESAAAAKDAAEFTRRLAGETEKNERANRKNAEATSAAAEAYRRLFGDTRQSLGITQRLRGEVLSLIAAYGGLYGVINLLGQVSEAYQTVEAAQARLNVANSGSTSQTAADLDFLRRTADRLGIEFGSLATEYSKFAIATQGTNLEGEATRKIFTSVAEAARVSRTSSAELSGVFVALTQIVSKGAVQMEELRQQLGDRLPGALQIMADGLGVSTAQLIKMMEAGEVTSDALVPFAEELDRRFGPGLGDALQGTSVALGRLKNAAFQALLTFGEAGFMEAFANLLNDITETLQSADFQTFLGSLSVAFAALADGLGFVIRNFQFFTTAIAAFTAIRLSPVIAGLIDDFAIWRAGLVGTAAAATAATGATTAMGVAATRAAAGASLLGRALNLIRANPIGLLLTVATSAMAFWVTEADKATEALERHRGIVDSVKSAYEGASGSVDAWRKNVETLTVTEAKRNLDDLVDAATEARNALLTVFVNDGETTGQQLLPFGSYFSGASQEYNAAIETVIQKWRAGQTDAKGLLKEIDAVNQQFDDGSAANKRYGEQLIDAAKKIVEIDEALEEAGLVVKAFSKDTDEAGDALDQLAGKADQAGSAVNDGFKAAMDGLKNSVAALVELAPKTKSGIDEVAAAAATLAEKYDEALAAARQLPDAIMRAAAEQDILNGKAEGLKALFDINQGVIDSGFGGGLVDRIIGVESGGNPTARNPNSTATGLGQFIESTWLRMFKQYFPDRAAGLSDAMILAFREDAQLSRQMTELYLRENAEHLQKAGIAITDANLYLSHFLGPGGATALLSSAPGTLANNVLGADQVSANASILDGKTREEVIAWAQRKVGISNEELQVQERLVEIDNERADAVIKAADEAIKKAEEAKDETKQRLADGEFEVQQQERLNAGKEREAAIQAALREAKQENAAITDAELAKVAEQAGKLFDLEQQQKNSLTTKEKAQKAEEAVNNLLAQRQALLQQIELAGKEGDFETQTALKAKVDEVNTALVSAIENAKQMWAAVGGTEADAAIAKLGAANMEAQNFSFSAKQNYLDWSRLADLFVTGLASAFDRFAQAVAEGKNVGEAARDAFLQFAADFLLQIARMIIQQAIFNALQGAFGGTKFGSLIGLGHTGGIVGSQRVGSGNQSRSVSPAIFAGAMRYHTGGIVGLAPNEVPIIAKKGEAMLTEDDPFHPNNRARFGIGSGGGQTTVKQRIVNAIDAPSFLEAALASPSGERIVLNWMRANADAIQSSMG